MAARPPIPRSPVLNALRPAADRPACVGTPAAFWFDEANAAEAIEICDRCPVSLRCLIDALAERDYVAVRGGTTGRERRRRIRGLAMRSPE